MNPGWWAAGLAVLWAVGAPWLGGTRPWTRGSRLAASGLVGGAVWGTVALLASAKPMVHGLSGGGEVAGQAAGSAIAVLWLSVAVIDLREQVIPNRLVLASMVAGAGWTWVRGHHVIGHLVAGAVIGISFALISRFSRGGLGMGDAKFSGAVGTALGWQSGFWALSLGAWSAGLYALASMLVRRPRRRFALGPFLAAGGFLAWLAPAAHLWH